MISKQSIRNQIAHSIREIESVLHDSHGGASPVPANPDTGNRGTKSGTGGNGTRKAGNNDRIRIQTLENDLEEARKEISERDRELDRLTRKNVPKAGQRTGGDHDAARNSKQLEAEVAVLKQEVERVWQDEVKARMEMEMWKEVKTRSSHGFAEPDQSRTNALVQGLLQVQNEVQAVIHKYYYPEPDLSTRLRNPPLMPKLATPLQRDFLQQWMVGYSAAQLLYRSRAAVMHLVWEKFFAVPCYGLGHVTGATEMEAMLGAFEGEVEMNHQDDDSRIWRNQWRILTMNLCTKIAAVPEATSRSNIDHNGDERLASVVADIMQLMEPVRVKMQVDTTPDAQAGFARVCRAAQALALELRAMRLTHKIEIPWRGSPMRDPEHRVVEVETVRKDEDFEGKRITLAVGAQLVVYTDLNERVVLSKADVII
ncbi:uncharacterized protein L3040_009584 [Drepanopeziza brunnea f. sp. 'multigermtubi']|nr:hypothetical protein L3040_009584 [Drepanopeziza brunnea f. sp. 'multigermtubi']